MQNVKSATSVITTIITAQIHTPAAFERKLGKKNLMSVVLVFFRLNLHLAGHLELHYSLVRVLTRGYFERRHSSFFLVKIAR